MHMPSEFLIITRLSSRIVVQTSSDSINSKLGELVEDALCYWDSSRTSLQLLYFITFI